eukprot:Sdes_comp20991_c0_seq1m19618
MLFIYISAKQLKGLDVGRSLTFASDVFFTTECFTKPACQSLDLACFIVTKRNSQSIFCKMLTLKLPDPHFVGYPLNKFLLWVCKFEFCKTFSLLNLSIE